MKRFFAAILLLCASCSKDEVSPIIESKDNTVTLSVGAPQKADIAQTKVYTDFPEGESWPFLWSEGDALIATCRKSVSGSNHFEYNPFTMSSYGAENSTFTGELQDDYDLFALLYAFNQTPSFNNNKCTVNIAEQDGRLNKSIMCSDILYPTDDISSAISLYHKGAFMILDMTFSNVQESDITINQATYEGLNSAGTFYVTKSSAWENLTKSTIELSLVNPVEVTDGGNEKIYMNFIPTELVANDTLKITIYFSNGKKRVFTMVVDSDGLDFEAGVYYTSTIPCDMESVTEDGVLFANGEFDTATTSYTISNPAHMRSLATLVNDGSLNSGSYTFTMTNDIDLEGLAWTPIGGTIYPFRQQFDGANYTISGLDIDSATEDYQALFGYLTGTVKNLTVEGTVWGDENVAGIAAYTSEATISNCNNGVAVNGNSSVGGVVGFSGNSVSLSGCSNYGDVTGDYRVGGVVGYSYASHPSKCYNVGDVVGRERVGGLVGDCDRESIVNDCYNSSSVDGNGAIVGGLVGQLCNTSQVVNSYNVGSVAGDSNVGGVAGVINSDSFIVNCYSAASVENNYSNAGGLSGNVSTSSVVTSCYWATDITGAPTTDITLDMSGRSTTTGMRVSEMKLSTFMDTLNGGRSLSSYDICPGVQSVADDSLPSLSY